VEGHGQQTGRVAAVPSPYGGFTPRHGGGESTMIEL
jgi:hypothetical protein